MTYLLILGALALVPVVLIVALKVNAAIAFMSLCLGSVLVTLASGDVTSFLTAFGSGKASAGGQWVRLALLIVPFLLAILFTRKSISGRKQFTNLLPAIASGLLFALLVIPLLSGSLQHHITAQPVWQQLSNLQTAILLAGAVFSLLFLLVTHGHHRTGDKHSKH